MKQQPWATRSCSARWHRVCGNLRPRAVHGARPPCGRRLPHQPALLPVFAHLAIVLLLGLYIRLPRDWYRAAAA